MTISCDSVKEITMKIQKLSAEHRPKAYALLRRAFPGSEYEARLIEQFHQNNKPVHEWICIHTGKAIAYIAFSNAFNGRNICGLHLAPMAVSPDFQRQGVGAELLRFALRQEAIKSQPLFVLGEPNYYKKFGFEPCSTPICPYDKNNAHFLSIGNAGDSDFTVGYEAEFKTAAKQPKPTRATNAPRPKGKKRR
jgi:putative acetyltransferase